MITNAAMRKAILRGIEKANRKHVKWTKNFWVSDYAAERLIQVEIAAEIFAEGERARKDDIAVFLETSISEMCGPDEIDEIKKRTGIDVAPKLRHRPDISTWMRDRKNLEDDWAPHLIEVKKHWDGSVKNDFIRCGEYIHMFRDYYMSGAFVAVFLHIAIQASWTDGS